MKNKIAFFCLILLSLSGLSAFSQNNEALEVKMYFQRIGDARIQNGSLVFIPAATALPDFRGESYTKLHEILSVQYKEFAPLFDTKKNEYFFAYWLRTYGQEYDILEIIVYKGKILTIKTGYFKTIKTN